MNNGELSELSRDELMELLTIYSKNWLAMDGVWFQSIERKYGMEEAIYHDVEAWRSFTIIEARRIKEFLKLPEKAGLEGLEKALPLRFQANLNTEEITVDGNTLICRLTDCRAQSARKRRGMEYHPCKPVGIVEYEGFARTIDERISCECLSCYPDITDDTCYCAWRFTLNE